MQSSAPNRDSAAVREWRAPAVWLVSLAGILAIGVFDYASGTELRVYPLYYAPIALLAWHARRGGAFAGAVASATSWLVFNALAGISYSHPGMLAVNAAVNGVSFLFVGLLIATLKGALRETVALSRTDVLTKLRNTRAFYEDSAPLLALCSRSKRPITLAYLDLDNFKSVNDTYGHQAGDALIRVVGAALRDGLRPSDLCARMGGDEFAILLPELGQTEASAALERIRDSVRLAVQGVASVTASIGAVTFLVPPRDIETLVRHADALMYDAKKRGRNRLVSVEVAESDVSNAV